MNYQERDSVRLKGTRDETMGLRIGSLFSGIGGLELGLEWAGVGHTVYQCETDPHCRSVLDAHWPGVPCYDDVTTLEPETLPAVDVICGGFPCQDVSTANAHGSKAGTRTGTDGARSGLWRYMADVIERQRPEWVIVENIARGQSKWLPRVRRDLGQLGYETLPVPLAARLVGAPHVRERIFVLAHADGFAVRKHEQRVSGRWSDRLCHRGHAQPLEPRQFEGWQAEPRFSVVDDGLPQGLGGRYWSAVGNAAVPQCAEVIGYMIRELSGA